MKIVTWNVGFGGMGAEAEIRMDGGRRFIPSSLSQIRKNILGIQAVVKEYGADVFLLQEISHGSMLNYWHNIEKSIQEVLKEFNHKFAFTFKFPLITKFLRNEHGLSTYVHPKYNVLKIETIPYEKSEIYYRFIKRRDSFLVTTIIPKVGKELILINTHLSSFDKDGVIRKAQCKEVLQYAETLYKDGHLVIIGADWNMRLTGAPCVLKNGETRYNTAFPIKYIPSAWKLHFSDTIPSVRATNSSYKRESATTAVIDGFVCSPGISVETVHTLDLGFSHSDHNPVEIIISYDDV